MNNIISKIGFIFLIGLAFSLFYACKNDKRGQTAWETTRIERGRMENSVTATGTVEPITWLAVTRLL